MRWKLIAIYMFHLSSGHTYPDYQFVRLFWTRSACEDYATEFLGTYHKCADLGEPGRKRLLKEETR